jgi:hypothetical protein
MLIPLNPTENFFSDFGRIKCGAPHESILDLYCSLCLLYIYIYIYIYDLPLRINSVSEQTLFAEDASGTFITNKSNYFALRIGYKENCREEIMNINFFGLHIENRLYWWNVMEGMISKRSGACYAGRTLVPVSNINTIKSIYYAWFHSIIEYGTILWGNSSNSGKIIA